MCFPQPVCGWLDAAGKVTFPSRWPTAESIKPRTLDHCEDHSWRKAQAATGQLPPAIQEFNKKKKWIWYTCGRIMFSSCWPIVKQRSHHFFFETIKQDQRKLSMKIKHYLHVCCCLEFQVWIHSSQNLVEMFPQTFAINLQ